MKRFKIAPSRRVHGFKIIMVDDCDAHLLRNITWAWYPREEDRGGFVIAQTGKSRPISGGRFTLARCILGLPFREGNYVEFVNGDNLDFRRENLMVCSGKEHLKRAVEKHKALTK